MNYLQNHPEVIVGIFAVVAAIVIPIGLHFARRGKKELTAEIMYEVTLLFLDADEVPAGFDLTYKGNPIRNSYQIMILFKNSGSQPILSADFETPISLSTTDTSEAKIIYANVVDPEPEDLNAKATLRDNHVEISPILLNAGDSFSLMLIVSDYEEDKTEIDIKGRIVGIKQIKTSHGEFSPPIILRPWLYYPIVAILSLLGVFLVIFEVSYISGGLFILLSMLLLFYRNVWWDI